MTKLLVTALFTFIAIQVSASDLVIEAAQGGVSAKNDRFSATGRRIVYDEAKSVLTISGDKEVPACLISKNAGMTTKGLAISYDLKLERIRVTAPLVNDDARERVERAMQPHPQRTQREIDEALRNPVPAAPKTDPAGFVPLHD